MSALARLLTAGAVRAARIFYRLQRTGSEVPAGPVLLVANHANMLLDPLLLMRVTGRRAVPLVKAPHLRTPVFGWVLRGLGALPVYRRQDDPRLLAKNQSALGEAADVLREGRMLLVFPEGGSEPGPVLRPLKTGASRVALSAEAAAGWTLDLVVLPLGLSYEGPGRFRSRALAVVGEPIRVAGWRAAYERSPAVAIRELTDRMTAGLESALLDGQARQRGAAAAGAGTSALRLIGELPLAALGSIVWGVPYAICGLAPILGRPGPETVSTVKLLTAIVVFPLTYLAAVLVAARAFGSPGLAAAALTLPPLFAFTLDWHDRRREHSAARLARRRERSGAPGSAVAIR